MIDGTIARLLLEGLACWRLSSLLTAEKGPWEIFAKLRRATGMEYTIQGNLVSWPAWNPLACLWCTTLWVAPVVHWGPRWISWLLSVSAIAIVGDMLHGYSENTH